MLNETIKFGNITLDGRIVMPPMGTYKATADGKVTDAIIDYYAQRARNPHVGMIITEHSYVSFAGKSKANQLGVDSDDKIEGLRQLVDTIHAHGTKVMVQLNHAGGLLRTAFDGQQPKSPSGIVPPVSPAVTLGTQAMTEADISQTIADFAAAALRAKRAGADAVEIHAAHGYLCNQFLSPLTNSRTDQWGGTLENRARMLMEVYRAVLKAVGADFAVAVRLGNDYLPGGTQIADSVQVAQWLAAEGADLIDCTGGMTSYMRRDNKEPGWFADYSQAVKAVAGVPVLVTGGVKTLAQAESLLREGKADLIGVGRQLMINPNWEAQ